MKLGRINAWPAFADMLFVLFVCTLVGAIHYRNEVSKGEKAFSEMKEEAVKRNEDNQTLGEKIRTLFDKNKQLEERFKQCGVSKPLIDGIRSCLKTQGIEDATDAEAYACEVEIGEKTGLKFQKGSKVRTGTDWMGEPEYKIQDGTLWASAQAESVANKVAQCVVKESNLFLSDDRESFEDIKSIFIDGYTDCDGNPENNSDLGAKRARRLVSLILKQINTQTDISAENKGVLLGKFNLRSFGENRPVGLFRQLTDEECIKRSREDKERDRRVTISIEQQVTDVDVSPS